MSKMFDVVGVSRARAGFPLKFRVANGKPARRARTLVRAGCVDIELFQVEPMSKEAAWAWFQAEKPELAAEVKGKVAKAPKSKAVKAAAKAVKPEVEVVDVALSPAAKLALKRAKDAARKREKRAAEKAAKTAVAA